MTAPSTERDATLDLLVPAPSRVRRAVAVVVGIALVGAVVAGGLMWPRTSPAGWGFHHAAESVPVAVGGTELRITGLDLPMTLRAVDAPPGWRIRSVGVVDPSRQPTDVLDTVGLHPLPARVRDGSRIVVDWELDCDATVALLRDPATASDLLAMTPPDEGVVGDPRDEPVRVGDRAAHLDLRVLGGAALIEPAFGVVHRTIVRTPTFDVAAVCGLSDDAVDEIRPVGY